MEIQLIRNATIKLKYAGKILIIDPMLCEKETFPPFASGLKKNPVVNLKMPIRDIVDDVDAILITHTHPDHFDQIAAHVFPKDIKVFCAPSDKHFIENQGFKNVEVINQNTIWETIVITRVEGKHGSGPVLTYMGEVSGYVLQANGVSSIYFISDSILIENVKKAIEHFAPKIIVTNSGGGIIPGFEKFPVHMDEQQTIEAVNLSSISTVIAVHLDAIDFCRTTRKSLRLFADKNGVTKNRLLIPEDGETLRF